MRIKPAGSRGAILAGALLALVGLTTSAPATAGNDAKPGIIYDTPMADPVGAGSLNDEQMKIVDTLAAWSSAHLGVLGRVTVDSQTLGVTVDVVADKSTPSLVNSLQSAIASVSPASKVSVGLVATSMDDLTTLLERVRAGIGAMPTSSGILSANMNDAGTGIVVAVASAADVSGAQALMFQKYGSLVTVNVSTFRTNSRQHDSTPYYAGIPFYNSAGNFLCTSGPYVNKAGYGNYMLSAAHCVNFTNGFQIYHYPYSQPTTLTYIGYSGANSSYADGALFTGSYGPYIWLGSPTSVSAHSVDRRVVSEGIGTTVCNGGAATGQVCRNNITNLDFVTPAGVHTVVACNTDGADPSKPGDSGASVYHVDSAGLLYIHGIDNGDFGTGNPCFAYVPMYRLESALGITLNLQ